MPVKKGVGWRVGGGTGEKEKEMVPAAAQRESWHAGSFVLRL